MAKKKEFGPELDAATRAKLEEEHGDDLVIIHCENPKAGARIEGTEEKQPPYLYTIAMKKPTRHEYKAFRADANDPVKNSASQERLLLKIAVFPAGAAFDKLLDLYPGIPESTGVSKAIKTLVGLTSEETEKE